MSNSDELKYLTMLEKRLDYIQDINIVREEAKRLIDSLRRILEALDKIEAERERYT